MLREQIARGVLRRDSVRPGPDPNQLLFCFGFYLFILKVKEDSADRESGRAATEVQNAVEAQNSTAAKVAQIAKEREDRLSASQTLRHAREAASANAGQNFAKRVAGIRSGAGTGTGTGMAPVTAGVPQPGQAIKQMLSLVNKQSVLLAQETTRKIATDAKERIESAKRHIEDQSHRTAQAPLTMDVEAQRLALAEDARHRADELAQQRAHEQEEQQEQRRLNAEHEAAASAARLEEERSSQSRKAAEDTPDAQTSNVVNRKLSAQLATAVPTESAGGDKKTEAAIPAGQPSPEKAKEGSSGASQAKTGKKEIEEANKQTADAATGNSGRKYARQSLYSIPQHKRKEAAQLAARISAQRKSLKLTEAKEATGNQNGASDGAPKVKGVRQNRLTYVTETIIKDAATRHGASRYCQAPGTEYEYRVPTTPTTSSPPNCVNLIYEFTFNTCHVCGFMHISVVVYCPCQLNLSRLSCMKYGIVQRNRYLRSKQSRQQNEDKSPSKSSRTWNSSPYFQTDTFSATRRKTPSPQSKSNLALSPESNSSKRPNVRASASKPTPTRKTRACLSTPSPDTKVAAPHLNNGDFDGYATTGKTNKVRQF